MSPRHQSQLYERLTKPYATYTATGDVIIGRGGKVYPRNSVLDVLRMFGLNVTIEDLAEVEKRKILKEYNDLKYEQDKEIYKLRKEIVLENWEQLIEAEGIEESPQPTTEESFGSRMLEKYGR